MTDEEMAEKYVDTLLDKEDPELDKFLDENLGDLELNKKQAGTILGIIKGIGICSYLTGLKAGRPKWHKRLERPKEKINALCFDIEQNKFILGFYDLEADEWLRYGGYETIYIDLWTKIEIPEFIKE